MGSSSSSSCLGEACSLEETQVALPGRGRGAGDALLQPHHFSELHGRSTSSTELGGTHLGEERRLRLMRVSGTKVEVVRIVGDRQPGWFLRMVEGGEKVGVLFWWEAQAGYAWWLFGGLGDVP